MKFRKPKLFAGSLDKGEGLLQGSFRSCQVSREQQRFRNIT